MRKLRLRRFAAMVAGTGMLALIAPAAGQASFQAPYNTSCSGSDTADVGTLLQDPVAHTWEGQFTFLDTTSPLSCASHQLEIGYTVRASAAVLEEFGSVAGERFGVLLGNTEEPPTLEQWLKIDLGDKPLTDSGLIRQIPVAVAAVVPIVNFPAGCSIPAKEATVDGRFVVSNAQLEKAYAGTISTWGELVPGLEGSCASTPIQRVVPESAEGTTFVFKQWLNKVNSKTGWLESSGLTNAAWPADSGATATVRSEGGDSHEALLTSRTNGSIGFASLAWARFYGFGRFSPENPRYKAGNTLFWLSVENGNQQRVEPTRDPHSGADNVLGANCDDPQFNITPSGFDTTATPIWRAVSAVGSKAGWPICTLTYSLAWDDAGSVYGSTNTNVEGEQRTIKDYLAYVLGEAGQREAEREDFSALPAALLADARDGQSRVGWDKLPGSKEEQEKISKEIPEDAKHH
ncbi:MAG: substrate-binding domain-containing protein [Acidobacteriaceae bacterium]